MWMHRAQSSQSLWSFFFWLDMIATMSLIPVSSGGLGLAAGAALIGTDLPAGACERAAIYSIIAWQLASGARLLSRGRADDRRADGRAR